MNKLLLKIEKRLTKILGKLNWRDGYWSTEEFKVGGRFPVDIYPSGTFYVDVDTKTKMHFGTYLLITESEISKISKVFAYLASQNSNIV